MLLGCWFRVKAKVLAKAKVMPKLLAVAGTGLALAVSGLGFAAARAAAPSPAAPTLLEEPELLQLLERLGVTVESRGRCGAPGQLATYNMGANQLCLGEALAARPAERSKVLHHELVHVVQDCLDGLGSPTSQSLAQGLRSGGLSGAQLNAFFLQYLRQQGNLQHVVTATAALPQDSRQREMEAYALQADPALVQRLLRMSCHQDAAAVQRGVIGLESRP